jgi:hypothetical protein
MSQSGKRIAVACLLTLALGLMLCPPWRGTYYHGHRLLWNGRGSLDWSRLALELCLVAVIGALAAVVAPMVGRSSGRALRGSFRRAGLVFGCAAVLILAATAGYDGIVRFALLRDYNRKVQEFRAKGPLLQEAFPLDPSPTVVTNGYQIQWDNPISNVHEAELMLRSLGCDDRSIQRAMARLLSASTPEYNEKTLTFGLGVSGGKNGDCLPQDIFDKVTAEARATAKTAPAPQKASPKLTGEITVNARDITPAPPAGFTEDVPTPAREIVFDFRIENSDAAKRFFAPLPDWYAEALQHNIEVSRVPDWMKPGEPPTSWSLGEWLDSRSSWLILAGGMLVLSTLCFLVARRIDRTTGNAKSSAAAAT